MADLSIPCQGPTPPIPQVQGLADLHTRHLEQNLPTHQRQQVADLHSHQGPIRRIPQLRELANPPTLHQAPNPPTHQLQARVSLPTLHRV